MSDDATVDIKGLELTPSRCGSCLAGVQVMNGNEVHRCDECRIYQGDWEAAQLVILLLSAAERHARRTPAAH